MGESLHLRSWRWSVPPAPPCQHPVTVDFDARTYCAPLVEVEVEVDGQVVGSGLVGQSFAGENGESLPQYFQPRLGVGTRRRGLRRVEPRPQRNELVALIQERRAAVAELDEVDPTDWTPTLSPRRRPGSTPVPPTTG
jgi:hypothetical protein